MNMFSSPGPVAFHIAGFPVYWYGILIASGILLCYGYILLELKRRKLDPKPVEDMAFWVILSGVIGARLYYILFNLSYFLEDPLQIFAIRNGGLAIHGALIGGATAFLYFAVKHRLHWLTYLDIMTPGVLLAQAVGRWGNFFNNEAFGRPTNLPWKVYIPEEHRPAEFVESSYFHPTFLYESLWNLAGFILLVLLSRKFTTQPSTLNPRSRGAVFFAYLVWYSFGRFFIEGLRTDSLYIGPFRTAQVMSAFLFFLGICGLIFVYRKTKLKFH